MGPNDLVSVTEIATRAKVKPDTVHKWRQRHSDFPSPFTTVGGVPVWVWPDVEKWLAVERSPGRPKQATTEKLTRWYVWINGVRKVTWAPRLADVQAKVPHADRIEPAPPLA